MGDERLILWSLASSKYELSCLGPDDQRELDRMRVLFGSLLKAP